MLPDGQQQPQLGGFKSEAEAKKWIERDSAEWLKGYERQICLRTPRPGAFAEREARKAGLVD